MKRNQLRVRNGEAARVYYHRVIKSDGTSGWCGGKALAQSAAYTVFLPRPCWPVGRPNFLVHLHRAVGEPVRSAFEEPP